MLSPRLKLDRNRSHLKKIQVRKLCIFVRSILQDDAFPFGFSGRKKIPFRDLPFKPTRSIASVSDVPGGARSIRAPRILEDLLRTSRDGAEKSRRRRPFGGFAGVYDRSVRRCTGADTPCTTATRLYEASLMRHRYLWGHLHIAKHIEPRQMAAGTRETPEYSSR